MILIIFWLIVGIVIVFGIIAKIDKSKYIDISEDIRNCRYLPQAVLLKNGQVILAQIVLMYSITDIKKAKKAIKDGINIFRKLEYEGITSLRKFVDNVDDVDSIIVKLENDLKKKLSEIAQEFGAEIIELHNFLKKYFSYGKHFFSHICPRKEQKLVILRDLTISLSIVF